MDNLDLKKNIKFKALEKGIEMMLSWENIRSSFVLRPISNQI